MTPWEVSIHPTLIARSPLHRNMIRFLAWTDVIGNKVLKGLKKTPSCLTIGLKGNLVESKNTTLELDSTDLSQDSRNSRKTNQPMLRWWNTFHNVSYSAYKKYPRHDF